MWWRDFPYGAREATPRRPFAETFDGSDDLAVTVDLGRKRRACEAYVSQLGFQFGGTQALAERLAATDGIEHFARPTPRTADASVRSGLVEDFV